MAWVREFRVAKCDGAAAAEAVTVAMGGWGVKLRIGGSVGPTSSNAWRALTARALKIPLLCARGAPAMMAALALAAAISRARRVIVSDAIPVCLATVSGA